MKKTLPWLLCFLSLSCGKDLDTKGNVSSIQLKVQLPSSISRSSGRFQHFLNRVEFLEVEAEQGGFKKSYRFPPSKWETLDLPEVPIPKDSGLRLRITIRIWDRLEDGFRRRFAILSGEKEFTHKDFERANDPALRIVLHPMGDLNY